MHTLLINLSCSSACLAILRACLDKIFLVCTACLDSISLVWATFYNKKKTWNKTFTAYNRPKSQLKKDSIFFTNIFFILGEEKKFKPWMDLSAWVRCSHVNHPPAPTSLHYSSFFLTFSSKKLLFFDKELREGDCGRFLVLCVCVCAGACLERNGLSPMLFDGFIKY